MNIIVLQNNFHLCKTIPSKIMFKSFLFQFSRLGVGCSVGLLSLSLHKETTAVAESSPSKDAEYSLYFWHEKTRGNFVRLILEECDVKYNDMYSFKDIGDKFQSPTFGKGRYGQHLSNFDINKYQAFSPPLLLKDNDPSFMLSQCIVIVDYLSTKHKLCPKSIDDKYKSLMIVNNAIDAFEEMVRFGTMMRYYNNEENIETNKKRLLYWFNQRLPAWLDIFTMPLNDNYNNGSLYYFENRITESDLAIFNLLDGIKEFIGDDLFDQYINKNKKYKSLMLHYQNVLNNSKSVKKLYKRQDENNFHWWMYKLGQSEDFLGIKRCQNFLKECLKNEAKQ